MQDFAFMAKGESSKQLEEQNLHPELVQPVWVELLQILGQVGPLEFLVN
jgi:hypothetical protein